MRVTWKRIPTDELLRRGEGPLFDDEMGVAEPRRRTTLMALLEEVDTAERINEDRRIRATLQRQAAESNPNAIDEESGEDLVEVDEFVDSEDGGLSEDGSTQLENNPDYTFCYYCDDFVFKDSWNPARRTKEDEYERYCLLHTGTSGYGRSYLKVEQVFGHSTIPLQLPDEDSEPESFSQSTHKNRKSKTANTQSVRVKPERMTPEQEFLWEYGSSEDEEDEEEPQLVTSLVPHQLPPKRKDPSWKCHQNKHFANRRQVHERKRVALSDEDSEDNLQEAEIATSSKRARVRKQELETRSEHVLPCDRKSPARLRKRKVVLSDEDSEDSLQESEDAASSKRLRQAPVRNLELETRSEQSVSCERKSPASLRKRKVVLSDEDSEDSLQQSENVTSSRRPRIRKQELETPSEEVIPCDRKSSARSRKGRVVLSDEDSEESLQQSESPISSKKLKQQSPVRKHEVEMRSEQTVGCEHKSPASLRKRTVVLSYADSEESLQPSDRAASSESHFPGREHELERQSKEVVCKSPARKSLARSGKGRVVLSNEDSENVLAKKPRQPPVGEHELDKSSEEIFHREHKSPARLRKRKVVLSDEDSEGSLQRTSSKKSRQSPVQEHELIVEINY
ncbi:hypothetical protein HDU80_003578 [Chytriomyces hyalinus]|nr:hypothetical protein HDU80_003578 [Chytriomyces hyalinus]